jgi:two-component system CheB/CheR fusion protein
MIDEARGTDGTFEYVNERGAGLELDKIAPGNAQDLTRVVALGGSAGSIQALQRFFEMMPPHSGMAFVVVVHLAPDHDSALSSVLQKATRMPVQQAVDGVKLLPDHVYVIPPGKHLSLTDGQLRLTELLRDTGKRMTVDLLFRSLADTHGASAIAIVLSGLDGDGALGVKHIKERGGLTIAQNPEEAEHPSMPRSAIATHMVDWVLDVEKMPARLLEYQAREQRLQMPPEQGPNPALSPPAAPPTEEGALRDVLNLLRARTGRDFSNYKRATIVRRIARRMQVNEVDDLAAYLDHLRLHAGEADALLRDMLISVTNFFRDREAFAALRARVPEFFRNKTHADTVRVWVPACATGEEAYSIAMLLSEHAKTMVSPPTLQVFGTDLDEQVLSEARHGVYPHSIANDVSEERLQTFFVKQPHGYRVRRELREVLLFAVHDLLKDAPFSRLDLISCRNLLIYLNRSAQKRVFDIFHFSLRPEASLFLGSSEALDDESQLFYAVDKKHRIYAARATTRTSFPIPPGPGFLTRALAVQDEQGAAILKRSPTSIQRAPNHTQVSWSAIHSDLVERLGPPSLIIDGNNDILHLSEGATAFLRVAGGEPSMNLFRVLNPMLTLELRAALFRARQTGQAADALAVPIDLHGARQLMDMRVVPASDPSQDFSLVVFDARAPGNGPAERQAEQKYEPAFLHLERELEQTKRNLRDVLDQQEASTEELQASNEELQAMNEELRSATEELETGREELQSINEELTTVNYELKVKVEELGQTNSHLDNLIGATAIATVFLDRDLCIMRFTPPAVELFSLIPTDVGRPLADLHHHLSYPELMADVARVLSQLVPIEREVAESGGRFFLVRLLPYRAAEDRIAGVVLTLVDVTELHAARQAILSAQQGLELKVQERTAELDSVNEALRSKIVMHEHAEKARQEMESRLVSAQEEERSRISRELHDELGQQIMALMLALKALESEANAEQIPGKLQELRAIVEQVGEEIHQLAARLRPIALDELGLSRALSGYLEAWMARSELVVEFFSSGIEDVRLPGLVETTLYRIVQQAMNNIYKHAAAKNISVTIERRGDHVLAIVEDDGSGFDQESVEGNHGRHLGIAGMRQRASIVGGELTIESRPGAGTTVRAKLPLTTGSHPVLPVSGA